MKNDIKRSFYHEYHSGFVSLELITAHNNTPEDFQFIDHNPVFPQLIGTDISNLRGKKASDIFSESDIRKLNYLNHFQKVIESGKELELLFYSEAMTGYYHVRLIPGSDKRIIAVFSGVDDHLRMALGRLFETGPAVVFKWKYAPGWPVEYVTDNVYDLVGYTPDEVMAEDFQFTELIHPDDFEWVKAEIIKHSEQGSDFCIHPPYRILGKDQQVRWVKDNSHIVRDENGAILFYIGYLLDITDPVSKEKALAESEKRLRTLINTSPDFICFKDGQGRWIEANQFGLELYHLDKNNYRGKTDAELADLAHPIYHDSFLLCKQSDEEAWQAGDLIRTEEEVPSPEGETRVFDVYKIPLFDNSGNRQALIVLGRDITELKDIEDNLRESEARFRKMFLQHSAPMLFIDAKSGQLIDVNYSAVDFYGYSAEQFGKMNIADINSLSSAEISEEMRRAEQHKENVFIFKHRLANGEIRDVEVYSSPIQHGDRQVLFSIIRDITQKKRAEEKLVQQFNLMDAILNAISNPIMLIDAKDYTVLLSNISPEEENKLKAIQCYELTHHRDQPCEDNSEHPCPLNMLRQHKKPTTVRHIHYDQDGRPRQVDIHAYPILDENGELIQFIEYMLDVTEQVQAQTAKIESQRLQAIGEFASGVAHDFNNSLESILGNIELSLSSNELPEELRENLESMKKSVEDAAARAVKLQNFGSKGKSTENYSALNLNQLIEDTIMQTRPLWKDSAERQDIHYTIETKLSDISLVHGNANELRSVLYNLLKNAIEAMPEGGSIKISSAREQDSVSVSVADSGMGMDEDTVKKIFQPFFSTKDFKKGRGLGMSGVFSVIQDHGGHISVKSSAPGEGTVIAFSLPVMKDKQKQKKPVDLSDNADFDPKLQLKVLWVDDEESIRLLGKRRIELLGHQADIAANGEEALERLERNKYDLVISDIGMPIMNGWNLSGEIRKRYGDKPLICILSGWNSDQMIEQMQEYDVNFLLSKPVPLKKIEKLLREVAIILSK